MNANELMIGDWVLISVWDCNPFPSKVTSINYNSYQGKDFVDWIDTEDEEEIGMYNIQPIPLTPEIMGKNCTLIEREYKFGEYPNILSIMYDSSARIRIMEGDCEYYGIEIKYVHELQHALRLAGIKKEIVL